MKNRRSAAKVVVDEVLKREVWAEKKDNRVADWDDSEDVLGYRREKYGTARDVLLNTLLGSGNRVCPCCAELYPDRRSWIVIRKGDKQVAICRSCVASDYRAETKCIEFPLFESSEVRYILCGRVLSRCRVMLKISRRAFAKECNWSNTYQRKLETSISTSISPITAARLIGAFKRYGADFKHTMEKP